MAAVLLDAMKLSSFDRENINGQSQLQDTDETLFIGFLCPIPHISFRWFTHQRNGEACMQFGHIISRAKGLHIFNQAERTCKGSTP
jgi:hypothetical protein